jgi:hypothetical protein
MPEKHQNLAQKKIKKILRIVALVWQKAPRDLQKFKIGWLL